MTFDGWECPCGTESPKPPWQTATPVRTLVALREPLCPLCGRHYRDEYRVAPQAASNNNAAPRGGSPERKTAVTQHKLFEEVSPGDAA
jgi:hypothetical protein